MILRDFISERLSGGFEPLAGLVDDRHSAARLALALGRVLALRVRVHVSLLRPASLLSCPSIRTLRIVHFTSRTTREIMKISFLHKLKNEKCMLIFTENFIKFSDYDEHDKSILYFKLNQGRRINT